MVALSPDAQPPVIGGCPADIGPVAMGAGVCGALVSWTAPTVSDICLGATITQTAGPASGSLFPAGVTAITYTANDGAGNTPPCSFTVTVSPDTQPPGLARYPAHTRPVPIWASACRRVGSSTAPTPRHPCPPTPITPP